MAVPSFDFLLAPSGSGTNAFHTQIPVCHRRICARGSRSLACREGAIHRMTESAH
eukprot:CAMPEP_0202337934 /NCGR_PEP_ID=MMETSP1126-20121109/417_1 /ASSEMBLY_ACC=CAM_ASM_000457 /TAXON_ID=3047 /ORGANISM="Dunaliella tertiolecta, Strain CCMP1320" /LENGTH=54 /DNA_ID=CAMNT_0048928223 /DNA_START=881 /DNA_END=1045 /DNA_ORIENTATION=+